MAIKHSLEQAWTSFKMEHEIREDFFSILNLSPQDLLKLNFGDQANAPKGWTTFDIAFLEWKLSLVKHQSTPDSPHAAIDSFALFWDKYLLNFLQSNRPLLKHAVLNYLKKRLNAIFYDLELQDIVQAEEDRRDAFNLAFAKCIQKWQEPDFSLQLGLVAYFKKAFTNACYDVARAAAQKIQYRALESLSPEAQKTVDAALEKIEKSTVRLALDAFGAKNSDCLKLIKMNAEGYSSKEIAAIFRQTPENIRTKTSRCREDFKQFFQSFNS